MPRYFFDIHRAGKRIVDEEGSDCTTLDEAKHEAKLSVRDVAAAALRANAPLTDICVEVRSVEGEILASLTVEELLKHPNTPEFGDGCPLGEL